uniref:EGF-like domain-containing protein n=1 Tax=Amphimedon queenslandica TaxID=400682 RepID=A0A1X7V5F3_AMPQE
MDAKFFSLLLVLSLLCMRISYTEGSAVCTVLKTRQASISAAKTVYYQSSYSISCGWWLFRRRCTVYERRSSIQYVTNYITEYYQGQECCTGYSGTPPNCPPVCNDPCSNCASCIAPGICTCDPGYTDNDCCTDINECSSFNGGCEHQCQNTVGSYTCSCPTGFSLVSHTACQDTNECASSNGGCSQICKNTPGSYYCECYPGYTLGSDSHTCNDNNECSAGTDACGQVCHNTVGSYACSCNSGYLLATSDHRTCNDINECLDGDNGGCHGTCTNTVGSRTCSCSSGYVLTNGNECP